MRSTLTLLLMLPFAGRAAPTERARHFVLVHDTYASVPSPSWVEPLEWTAKRERGFEWRLDVKEFGESTPLIGSANEGSLDHLDLIIKRLTPGERAHVDYVVDGHGSPSAFGAKSCPFVPYGTFAARVSRMLDDAAARGLGRSFTLRLYIDVCYAGRLARVIAADHPRAYPFAVTLVNATSGRTTTYGPILPAAVKITNHLMFAARSAGARFTARGTYEDEVRLVLNLITRHQKLPNSSTDKDIDPVEAVGWGQVPDSKLEISDAFIRGLAKTYLWTLRRSEMTSSQIRAAYAAPSSDHLRTRVREALADADEAGTLDGVALLDLQTGPAAGAVDAWLERLRRLSEDSRAFVRLEAVRILTRFPTHAPPRILRERLDFERTLARPHRRSLVVLEDALNEVVDADCGAVLVSS